MLLHGGAEEEGVGSEQQEFLINFFILEENYQRKPARAEPIHLDRQDSLLTRRHPHDLGCCRRLPPGAQIASNRFSYPRQLIEPRSCNTPFQPDDACSDRKRDSNELNFLCSSNKSIKTIRLKYAVQINNKTLETIGSEKVKGKKRRCENDLTTLKAEDTQLSIDRGGRSDI
jgi:hypothetical protein